MKPLRTSDPARQSDEALGAILRNAMTARVDQLMESAAAPVRHVAATPPHRRRFIVPVIAALSVVGVTGGVAHQLAQRPTPSPVDVVVQADAARDSAADEPRLVLRSPGFTAVAYMPPMRSTGAIDGLDAIHLRNGTTWFDVSISTTGSRIVPPDGTKERSVAVGSATGTLVQYERRRWFLEWKSNGVALRGFGVRPPTDADLEVLAAVRATSAKNLSTAGPFPHGFTATLMERQDGGYQITYRRESDDLQRDFSLSVRPSPPFASDYLEGQKIVERNGRKYAIATSGRTTTGPELGSVNFEMGSHFVFLFAPGTADSLLQLAEQVSEATPAEWARIKALRISSLNPSPPPALIDGDVDGTPFSLTSLSVKSAGCQEVTFHAEGTVLHQCVVDASTSVFGVLASTVVNGRTVVFGVTPGTGDNQVVRIVDGNGDVVAEDVTLDQDLIDGRTFALDLPNDAVAPFRAELYPFDRDWYANADPEPDSFVRPDAVPIASQSVPAAVPRSAE